MYNLITLSDFPRNKTFVYLEENYKRNIMDASIKKAGSQRLLSEELVKSIQDIKIKQGLVSYWLKRKNLRLDVVYQICEFINKNLDENKIKGIKGVGTSRMIFNPKLPIKLSPELACVLANLYCDGCIEPKNCYLPSYTNTCDELISQYKNYAKICFGDFEFGKKQNDNVIFVRIPCFIGKILYYKFKLYKDKVPRQIVWANRKIKSSYLRAVFDDEGTVSVKSGQLRLKMKPYSFVNDIKRVLEKDFDITCSYIAKELACINGKYFEGFYFSISGQYNLKKFYNGIGFTHPKKSRKLKKRIDTYEVETYGYGANKVVFEALKKGPKTVKELSEELNRDGRTIQYHLTNLKKEGLVDYIKHKPKTAYEYIWMDKSYIKEN